MKWVDDDPIPLEEFKDSFLGRLFPVELRKATMMEFMNLKQGSICEREYSLKFNNLSQYAPAIIVDPWARTSKFVSGVFDLINEERCTAMLIREIDISQLMTYAK